RVKADASTFVSDSTDANQSDVRTTGANGSIVIRSSAGSITLGDGTAAADGVAVSAHGTGNVLIQAGMASAPIVSPTVSLPASLTVLSTNGEIRFANAVGSGIETLTVLLSVVGGPASPSPAPTLTATSGGDVTVSNPDAATLSLTGRAVDISAYLNTANRVQFNGMASATPYSLMLTAQSMNGSGVQSATTSQAALSVVQLGVPTSSSSASLSAAPGLQVPAAFTVASVNGEIRLAANAISNTSGTFTMVLSVSHSSVSNVSLTTASGNGTADGVMISGSGTSVLTLTGTAADLNTYLKASDRVRFNGAASTTPYVLRFTAQSFGAGVAQSSVSAEAALTSTLLGVSGSATTNTPAVLSVPATINVLPTNGEIRFGANSVTGSGTLTVVLALSGGPEGATRSLSSLASTGVTVDASVPGVLTLQGTEAALRAHLSAANSVLFTGTSSATPYALDVTVQTRSGTAVTSAATSRVAIVTTGASGVAAPMVAPTLNIPSSFSTPAVNGELRFANAVGTGTDIVTVVLAVRGGPTGAAPTLSSALGNGVASDVTVSGNATSTLTLTGTASAVSTYLTASNRILFNGTASTSTYTITATAQRVVGGVVQSATTSQ
ncbi:MAG: hypothetical protein EB027_05920, partial [Actinobacteria bacterium]|nr:hypothetical protein [Actinomycetota bacterium]